MIQKKIIKILQLIVGVAKYCRVSMRCTKFRFPIGVIVFDELELISIVSQGLTLSTASLVCTYFYFYLCCLVILIECMFVCQLVSCLDST